MNRIKVINIFLDTMFVANTILMLIVTSFLISAFLCFIPPIPTNTIYWIIVMISLYVFQIFLFERRTTKIKTIKTNTRFLEGSEK